MSVDQTKLELILAEFKIKLADKGDKLEDFQLLKYLKARSYNIDNAYDMLTASIAWREARNVQGIVENFAFSEYKEVFEVYPSYFHKVDKIGRPIIINEMGFLDGQKLAVATTSNRFITHHIRHIEKVTRYRLPACFKANPKSNRQIFTIVDLKGIKFSLFPSIRGLISSVAQIDQDYYPELLGAMVIINAPYLFTAIWSVIRMFLDKATEAKIKIVGSNYKSLLAEFVDASNLPEHLGGTCSCPKHASCKDSDEGPWNDGTVEGYPIDLWEGFHARDELARSQRK